MSALILASTSRLRNRILVDAGFQIMVVKPTFFESGEQQSDASLRALARARGKALAVADHYIGRWVLGCDQVAEIEGECFGKPIDPFDHHKRLVSLRGRVHRLHTAVVVVAPDGELHQCVEISALTIRPDVSDTEIAAYVGTQEGTYCAGGYAVEGQGSMLFSTVVGDWNNVLGLPLFSLIGLLRGLGWRYGENGFEARA